MQPLLSTHARSQAPLPDNWKPCKTTDTDEIYYFNFATGESTWDHPCDEYYRNLYEEQRKKRVSGEKEMSDAKKKQAKDDVRKLLGKEDARDLKKKKGKRSMPELGPLSGDAGGFKSIFDRKPLPSITASGSSDFSASSPRTTHLTTSPKSVGADKNNFIPSVAESSLEKDGPSYASKRLSSALGPSDSPLCALPAARIKSNDFLTASSESEAKTARRSDEQLQEKRDFELRRTEREHTQLQSRVSQLTAAVENAEAIASDARSQLEAETRSNKLRVASLERELDRAQRRRDELQAEADDGRRRLAANDSEARRLKDNLQRLEDDLGNATERAAAAEVESKRWRERANATEAQHSDQAAAAQRAQQIAEDRVNDLQGELDRRRGEDVAQLASATGRIDTLERQLAVASKRAADAETELAASAAMSSKLEVAESKARQAEDDMTHRVAEMQLKLDEAERRVRVAQSSKGDELSKMLQSQLEDVNRRLAEVESAHRDEKSRLKSLLEAAEFRLNETEKAKQEVESRLKSQLEEAERRLIEGSEHSVSINQEAAQIKAQLEETERRLSENKKAEREEVSRLNVQLEDAERRLSEIARDLDQMTSHKVEAERAKAEAQARSIRAETSLADEKRKREELEQSREQQVSVVDTSADMQRRLAEAESQSDEARERAIKAQAALTAMEKMHARTGAELLAVRRKVDLLSAENEELQEWQRRHGMPIESPTTCASNQTLEAGSVSSRESSELARCNVELTELNERVRLLEQTLTSVEQRAVEAEERERKALVKEREASNALSCEREKLSSSERELQVVKAQLEDARMAGASSAKDAATSALVETAEARRDAAIRAVEEVRAELATARAEQASTSARQQLECAASSAAAEASERRRDKAEAQLAVAEVQLCREREEKTLSVRESAAMTKQLEARLTDTEARASQFEERGQRAETRVAIAESKLVALAAEKRAADAARRAAENALAIEKQSRRYEDNHGDAEQRRREEAERLSAAEAAVATAEAERRRVQAEATAACAKAESAEHRAALAEGHQTSAREAAVAAEERCADVERELRSARAAIVDLEKSVAEAVAAQRRAEAAGERAERAAAAKVRAIEDDRDVVRKRLDDELRAARDEAREANDKLHNAGDSAVLSIRAETAEHERNSAQARAVRAEASVREVSTNYETARERAERSEQERERALERAEVAETEWARAKEDLHVAQRANADLVRQLDQLRTDLARRARSRTEDQPVRSRASSLASRPTFRDTLEDGPTPQPPDDTMSSASSAVRRKPARSAWRDRVEVEHHAIVKATALVKRQRDWLRRKQRKLEQKRDEWRRRSSRDQPASDAARRRLDDETDDLNRLVRQLRGIQIWLGERETKIKRFELALQRSQRYDKTRRPEEDNEIDDDECASSELEDLGAELDDDARSLSSLFEAITPRRHEPRSYDHSSRHAAWPPPGSYIVVQPNQPPPFMFPSAYAPPAHPMAYASTIHQPPHLPTRPIDETRQRMDEWERLHLDTVRTSLVNAKLNGEASKSRTAAAHALHEQLREWTQNRTRASEAVQHHLKWLEHLRSELTAHAYGNTVAATTVPKIASDHPPYIPPPKLRP